MRTGGARSWLGVTGKPPFDAAADWRFNKTRCDRKLLSYIQPAASVNSGELRPSLMAVRFAVRVMAVDVSGDV